MENQKLPTNVTGSIGKVPPIGRNKYNYLKSKSIEELTDFEKNQLNDYEQKINYTPEETILKTAEYFEKVFSFKHTKEFSITARQLWDAFKATFPLVTGKRFLKTELTLKNIEPLIYYFSKDERFFQCEHLTRITEPSFDKGILIVGPFGNGKTSTMKVFEKIFKGIPGVGFKSFTANEVVVKFEKCSSEVDRTEFESLMYKGIRNFDDVKTERIASNYGKVNLFKDILEERYNAKAKTHITCNYKEGFQGDVEMALAEFGEKYGARVDDRMFEMFNVIVFKGKSFRK
ncbi:hypothetical protein [Flavobacterium anhuiense]|uniref:hypothetical protein n=1 Tax=Flavobacterium anhuiense TaxID=459526 RepID=UPI0020263AEB|nr:hypothetical protein [Flavobacterium anhuiense]URM37180.1 hypothetical protein LLY39_00885 [Flavobacterium anhuiense]